MKELSSFPLEIINWPNGLFPNELESLKKLCRVKRTRIAIADFLEEEGIILRDAAGEIFGDYEHPLYIMADNYSLVGQIIRQTDDSWFIFQTQEIPEDGEDKNEWDRQRFLKEDPSGFLLVTALIAEKKKEFPEDSPEFIGFYRGTLRYIELYHLLTAEGVKPQEFLEIGEAKFYPRIAGGAERSKKEKEYRVVLQLAKNLLVDEQSKVHAFWEKNGQKSDHTYETIQKAIDAHERVIQQYLGLEFKIDSEHLIRIAGENETLSSMAQELSVTSGKFSRLRLTDEEYHFLQQRLILLRRQLEKTTNEYKQRASISLGKAATRKEPEEGLRETLKAQVALFERIQQNIGIVEGTIIRRKKLIEWDGHWQGICRRTLKELSIVFEKLGKGSLSTEDRRQLVGILVQRNKIALVPQLLAIPASPYKERVNSPEIKRLSKIETLILDDEKLKKALEAAIEKLWRVEEDAQKKEILQRVKPT